MMLLLPLNNRLFIFSSAADEQKGGYIRVKAKIDNLKVKSAGLSSILTKHPHPKGKNADIERPEFGNRYK